MSAGRESLIPDVHQALGRCSCGTCHSIEEAVAMNTREGEGSLFLDVDRTPRGALCNTNERSNA